MGDAKHESGKVYFAQIPRGINRGQAIALKKAVMNLARNTYGVEVAVRIKKDDEGFFFAGSEKGVTAVARSLEQRAKDFHYTPIALNLVEVTHEELGYIDADGHKIPDATIDSLSDEIAQSYNAGIIGLSNTIADLHERGEDLERKIEELEGSLKEANSEIRGLGEKAREQIDPRQLPAEEILKIRKGWASLNFKEIAEGYSRIESSGGVDAILSVDVSPKKFAYRKVAEYLRNTLNEEMDINEVDAIAGGDCPSVEIHTNSVRDLEKALNAARESYERILAGVESEEVKVILGQTLCDGMNNLEKRLGEENEVREEMERKQGIWSAYCDGMREHDELKDRYRVPLGILKTLREEAVPVMMFSTSEYEPVIVHVEIPNTGSTAEKNFLDYLIRNIKGCLEKEGFSQKDYSSFAKAERKDTFTAQLFAKAILKLEDVQGGVLGKFGLHFSYFVN